MRYINYLDNLKEKYIIENSISDDTLSQFHFYQDVVYRKNADIIFYQSLKAVKLHKTSILFADSTKETKVYFTDNDISVIVALIKDANLKTYIYNYLNKFNEEQSLSKIYFTIQDKLFEILGIPFSHEFNDIICENPADIKINGNDLIALINLVLEKERMDKDPNKVYTTAKKYINLISNA